MADRVERLTNLLALLLETRRPLTLHEIASELEGQYPDAGQARHVGNEGDACKSGGEVVDHHGHG
ncbi:MAG: hypothetical protein ACPF97_06200, partial [Ilumatobacteraceae bacterium]